MRIRGIHHAQLAMPEGGEDRAREFYHGLLGLPEVRKPADLLARGGVWFETQDTRVHLGVDPEFRAAVKAHVALEVSGLAQLLVQLRDAGVRVLDDDRLEGWTRAYVFDPFGNRIELMEQEAG